MQAENRHVFTKISNKQHFINLPIIVCVKYHCKRGFPWIKLCAVYTSLLTPSQWNFCSVMKFCSVWILY